MSYYTLDNARNIPACAGKTHAWAEIGVGMEEHPRVRGENSR